MSGFLEEPDHLKEAMREAFEDVLQSGTYVLGPHVELFEFEWARVCGTSFAVGLGNGLDALEIALRALGVGPGHEVITTPITAFATLLAIVKTGATPVLADIDPHTGLLSIESTKSKITRRTRALVLVHLFGQMRRMREWEELCAREEILLVEDCAQAHLAEVDGRKAGSWGIAGGFSFYPTKNLGALGDAGALVTSTSEIARFAASQRNYGQTSLYNHARIGTNSRLDELQAAILLQRLKTLSQFTHRRQEIATKYLQSLDSQFVSSLLPPEDENAHVYHQFVVRTLHRRKLQRHLQENGIQSLIHYPVPAHKQPVAGELGLTDACVPVAEEFAETCLSLPCHPQLSDADIERIIDVISKFSV